MPMEASCPFCKKRFQFAEQHAGKRYKCTGCQNLFLIGHPEPQSSASQIPESPSIATPPAITTAAKRKKPRSLRLPKLGSGQFTPGFLGILMDFDFRHYYTPQLVRSSWSTAVLAYALSWAFTIFVLLSTWFPNVFVWAKNVESPGQIVLGLILLELFGLALLISYRVALEFTIVVFDISETLKTDRMKG
jgi:hypothetical protein